MSVEQGEKWKAVDMEEFNDLLLKLQEVHDREIEGWQVKVQELSNKKGCDTKRMEELYNRNQQMKEQQRILTENIKTLENRLRAGLCDRCTVTQEVAKKRQQEYESCHIQSMQHITLMAGEINSLKKENKMLRDEIRKLRAALERQSEHSSSSSAPAEVKHSSSLDTLPMALITKAMCRGSSQPADGDVAVKMEGAQRLEEPRNENRHLREWHKNLFDSYKPPPASTASASSSWKTQPRLIERRPQNEAHEQQQPNSPSVKSLPSSSPGAEAQATSRHILHAPVPCRPQPLKSTPGTLPWPLVEPAEWASVAGPNLVVQHSSKPNVPRFPNLIPSNQHINHSNQRRQVLGPLWHKSNAVQPPSTKEPTVVFRLRSMPEQVERQTKPQERKDTPPSKSEKESQDMNNKEVCEGPLDLSDTGRSKPNHRENSPVASQSSEAQEESRDGDVKDNSAAAAVAPASAPGASGSTQNSAKQEESTSEQNHKLVIKHLKQKDEVNGKPDNGKKVPVLTISLRPVVVLESLNSALQKQESSSSNQNSPEAEPGTSSEEKDEDDKSGPESREGRKRKRASVETEKERDSDIDNIKQERKVKITLRNEEKSAS